MRDTLILLGIFLGTAVSSFYGFHISQAGTLFSPPYVAFAATIVFAAYAVVRGHVEGLLPGWVRIRAGDFSRGFLGVLLLFGLTYAFNRLVMPTGSARESWIARLYLQFGPPFMLRNQQGRVAIAVVLAAISEELVWRGLVTSLLETKIGSSRAWLVSAGMYALALLPTAWSLRDPVAGLNPILPLGGFVAALVWGWMARNFGRLFPSVLSHALFDWAVIITYPLWGV